MPGTAGGLLQQGNVVYKYSMRFLFSVILLELAVLVRYGLPWNAMWWGILLALPLLSLVAVKLFQPNLRALRLVSLGLAVAAGLLFAAAVWERHSVSQRLPLPVMRVKAEYPTESNTQSKLWYFDGSWWAMLPDGEGTSVWTRRHGRWQRDESLDATALASLPGVADVWSEGESVVALIASYNRLSLVRLAFDHGTKAYRLAAAPLTWELGGSRQSPKAMKTAMITRDELGFFWIAYDFDNRIFVRRSLDRSAADWQDAMDISAEIYHDDIAIAFPTKGGVGVVWGDQGREALYYREHRADRPFGQWESTQVLAQGNRTADNQFNVAVALDGSIFLASKTSLDTVGEPLLSLRVKREGRWQSVPYRLRTAVEMPNRAIAILAGSPSCLYLVHGIFPQDDKGRDYSKSDYVAYYTVDPLTLDIPQTDRTLISPRTGFNIRAPSSARQSIDPGVELLVLASDKHGNVYEGVLPANCN